MSKKLKIGIIGSGMIAETCHIPAYQSFFNLCEVVVVCDIVQERAKEIARMFNIPKFTTDYKEILSDKTIDAVSVATPNIFHKQHTVDALSAGKHVLCEKPLAMNAKEAREMCLAARKANKILQVGLQQRFIGSVAFMKHFIDKGHMGKIYYAHAQALRRRGVPTWGVFMDKKKQGGGPLIDIGVHILDVTLYLMGYPKPVSASGKTWDMLGKTPNLYNRWGTYDRKKFTVEDFAVGLIRFEDDSAVLLESSFMGNLKGDPFLTHLYGEKAGAVVSGFGKDLVEIYTERDQQLFNMVPENIPDTGSPYRAEVHAFLDAILHKKPSLVPGEHGLVLNAIFDALYKSAETGKEERVEELLD
jgi:predicted dehydrogenase